MINEFDDWAKKFDFKLEPEWRNGKMEFKEVKLDPPICMFPRKEGPHKTACHKDALFRSPDGYPACAQHKSKSIRALLGEVM